MRDTGVSGTRVAADRPGLSETRSLVEDGEAQGVVVARIDRLARTLVVQEGILGKVWSMGSRVYSVDTGEVMEDDPDDPMRTALRQMVGVFAQMERGMIAARLGPAGAGSTPRAFTRTGVRLTDSAPREVHLSPFPTSKRSFAA